MNDANLLTKTAVMWENSRDAAVLETPVAPLTTPLLKGAGGMANSKRTPEDRFWAKVQKSDLCWLWTGAKFRDGYGYFSVQLGVGRRLGARAHRVSWEMVNGPVPAGVEVCHHCDVRACVRPEHLFIGSKTDNMRDASAKGRIRAQKLTHCAKGHEFTPGNTIIQRRPFYQRRCRACRREQAKRRWATLRK